MRDSADHADRNNRKVSAGEDECHCSEAQSCAGGAVQDTEHASEHRSDDDDACNRHESSLLPGVADQDKQDSQIGESQFDPGNAGKDRKQRFDISQDRGKGGEQTELRGLLIARMLWGSDRMAHHPTASTPPPLPEPAVFVPSMITLFGRQTIIPPFSSTGACSMHR